MLLSEEKGGGNPQFVFIFFSLNAEVKLSLYNFFFLNYAYAHNGVNVLPKLIFLSFLYLLFKVFFTILSNESRRYLEASIKT